MLKRANIIIVVVEAVQVPSFDAIFMHRVSFKWFLALSMMLWQRFDGSYDWRLQYDEQAREEFAVCYLQTVVRIVRRLKRSQWGQ